MEQVITYSIIRLGLSGFQSPSATVHKIGTVMIIIGVCTTPCAILDADCADGTGIKAVLNVSPVTYLTYVQCNLYPTNLV